MVLTLLIDYVLHVQIEKQRELCTLMCPDRSNPTCVSVSAISCSLLSSVGWFIAAAILPSQSTQSLSESDWSRQTHQHSPPSLTGLRGGFILVPLKADGLVNKVPKAFCQEWSHLAQKKKTKKNAHLVSDFTASATSAFPGVKSTNQN